VHKIKGDTAASSASAAQPIAQGGATLTLTGFTREGGGVIPASSVALRQGAITLTTGTGDAATVAGVTLPLPATLTGSFSVELMDGKGEVLGSAKFDSTESCTTTAAAKHFVKTDGSIYATAMVACGGCPCPPACACPAAGEAAASQPPSQLPAAAAVPASQPAA